MYWAETGWMMLSTTRGSCRSTCIDWFAFNTLYVMAFDPLPYAIPGFVILIGIEMVWARRTGRTRCYEMRDTAISLFLGLGSIVAGLVTAGAIAALMGTVGPLARRALPGLPRAQARYKL